MEPQTPIYEFDDVRVDVQNAQVWKAGQRLALEPKAFRVLVFLLERAGRLVEKEELLSAIWAETFVTENALTRAIALLRKVLGDSTAQAKYIETVPTRGYRFIAAVTTSQPHLSARLAGEEQVARIASGNGGAEANGAQGARSSVWKQPATWVAITVALAASVLIYWRAAGRQQLVGEHPGRGLLQVTNSTALDICPSFSPDGNTIAYSSNESGSFEIYLKQLTRGGSIVQLTNDGGRNLQPAWSPDGSTIAYYSQGKGGVWLIPALGGTAQQLTKSGSGPAWSPDGKEIVYQSGGVRDLAATSQVSINGSTLWIVEVGNGISRPLTQVDRPEGAHNSPAWSPDGKTIAFVTSGFKSPAEALWTITVDGSKLEKIGIGGNLFNPVFSRDGKSIYMSASFGVWKIALSGKRDQYGPKREKVFEAVPEVSRYLAISADGNKIAFSRVNSVSNIYSLPMSGSEPAGSPIPLTHDTRIRKTNPAISPDGRRVLFDVGSVDRNGGVWIVDTDTKTSGPVLVPCEDPAWLPDGKEFFCTQYVKRSTNCPQERCFSTEILKVNVATQSSERVSTVEQNVGFPAYTRDGKQMAFMSLESGSPNVWVVPTAGGEPRQVTFDTESMGFPAWSPDGKWLAVEQKRGDNDNIWLVETGKTPTPLTDATGQNWPGSFSPDGQKIAFVSNRDGNWNLWCASTRNHAQKKLTSYTSLGDFVRYPDWSPDGKFIAYEYAETKGNIWMLEVK